MITFIMSHKTTLQTLEIMSCPIVVSGATGEPLGFWSDIWNRFANGLTELVEVTVVAGPQEQTILGLGYQTFVENKEFEAYLLSLQVNSDRLALKKLEDVVEARRRTRI
jgi:hypothetical protein